MSQYALRGSRRRAGGMLSALEALIPLAIAIIAIAAGGGTYVVYFTLFRNIYVFLDVCGKFFLMSLDLCARSVVRIFVCAMGLAPATPAHICPSALPRGRLSIKIQQISI